MPGGGRITLSATETDDQVEIRVTDNGTGMTEDVRSRIFYPFFTQGKGRHGLGLAVSYGIICRHEGSFEVESELGRGTSFVIKLAVACPSKPIGCSTFRHYQQKPKENARIPHLRLHRQTLLNNSSLRFSLQ